MFERGELIKTLPITLLQMSCNIIVKFQAIAKSREDSDTKIKTNSEALMSY